ncbi:MAG: Hpt domain-containing protein [Gammaproteobacteria bacterium]
MNAAADPFSAPVGRHSATLTALLAERESTRRRTLRLWLTRAGHAVTAVATATDLAAAWHADPPWALRVLDPDLLGDVVGRRDRADDASAGIVWAPRTPGPPSCAFGPGVATYCPRARRPSTFAALCRHVLAPDTAIHLDGPTVGELLDVVGPRESAMLVARFEADTRALIETLARAAASADDPAWQRALHTVLGSTASIGARGLHDILAAQPRRLESIPWRDVAPRIERSLAMTLRCLARAADAYRAAASD